MTSDRALQVATAAWLHHVDGLRQHEIAERLGVSRATVSRLLKEARETGVVEVRVNVSLPRVTELESALRAAFPELRNALVEEAPDRESSQERAARAAARLLGDIVTAGPVTIAVGWGRTLSAMRSYLRPRTSRRAVVVDAVGHVPGEAGIATSDISQALASVWGARSSHIPAPICVDRGIADSLLRNPAVADGLRRAGEADVVVASVGTTRSDSTLGRSTLFAPDRWAALKEAGAIGDVLCNFFDSEGRPVEVEDERVWIGLSREDLQQSRRVIAVVGGVERAGAATAAIRAGLVDDLIVDSITAAAMLESLPQDGRTASLKAS